MNLIDILTHLEKSRTSISNLKPPQEPGVYAIFLKPMNAFSIEDIHIPQNRLIYIGMSNKLFRREFGNHFNPDPVKYGSSRSTLRRSIGVLFKDEWKLKAIPRGKGTGKKDFQNFRFNHEGEEKITSWMAENLEVGLFETKSYKKLEKDLKSECKPILCLEKLNPYFRQIKNLRKRSIEEAKLNKYPRT